MRKIGWLIARLAVAAATLAPQASSPLPTNFPNVVIWNSLTITPVEHPNYWGGRRYAIDIHGDGRIGIEGITHFGNDYRISVRTSPAVVEELIGKFREADFFNLRDAYAADIKHVGPSELSLRLNGQTKTVRDRFGFLAAMPSELSETSM